MKLTVIFRDDCPMIFCGDSPSYRSVQINLTQEQEKALSCRKVGVDRGNDIYEAVSKCFIENQDAPEERPPNNVFS